jgi:hypothetical protein
MTERLNLILDQGDRDPSEVVETLIDPTAGLLQATLAVAVPLRIAEMPTGDTDYLRARCEGVADLLGEHGTALLWREKPRVVRGKQLPGTAEVFNALVDALAAMALLADGGVTWLGLHFCPGGCARCQRSGES